MVQNTQQVLYDTMYGYAGDADISHYEHSNIDKDAPEHLVEAFQPIDDPNFRVIWDDEIKRDGKTYTRVNWGEDETSYLADDALYDSCYVRYIVKRDATVKVITHYISDGKVYETYEKAEEVHGNVISRNVLQMEDHAVNNGFALALPRNYYDLSDSDQYRVLADAYNILIEYYGWF